MCVDMVDLGGFLGSGVITLLLVKWGVYDLVNPFSNPCVTQSDKKWLQGVGIWLLGSGVVTVSVVVESGGMIAEGDGRWRGWAGKKRGRRCRVGG